jgi:hypothetical protein
MARVWCSRLVVVALFSCIAPLAAAADLDVLPPPDAPAHVIRGVGPRPFNASPSYALPFSAIDPRCRLVPQPETNLFGTVTRYRPMLVCLSRGIYADTLPPY